MLTSKAVIQKIDARSKSVRLYQNFNLHSPWSFETHRSISREDQNTDIFPFMFHGAEQFTEGRAGRETKLQVAADGRVLFADDYGVPAGFLIGVLFPENYVPEVFKFESKPCIPTGVGIGGTSMSPPGHFDVYYNRPAKRSAVVFMVTQPTYFGFKCIARKRIGDFPDGGEYPFLSDLYATLGVSDSHPIEVSTSDLSNFANVFAPSADLGKLADAINRLSDLARQNDYASVGEAQTLSKQLQSALSNTASAVQLSDSYLTGGTVAAVVSRLLAFLTL